MTASSIRTIPTRHGPMLALANDIYITRSLQVYGEYCPDEARALESLIKPGWTVIEVGANIGSHTVALARRCAPGPLYAFEPQPRVFQILCANLAMNEVVNVLAYPDASGAEAGWASLPVVDFDTTGNFGGVSVQAGEAAAATQRVRVTPIDDLPLDACHLIKVDVEGWEAHVLRGAERTIARCRPLLYVENDRPDRQQALLSQIADLGYRMHWHAPSLYSPNNFNQIQVDIFGAIGSLNLLCIPNENPLQVRGAETIDPANWRSPFEKG